ncbi:MAG: glycosyltransferase [Patescibacteria group bacterium]|nr:glycosyltransferase [Patescibacteria group bacterium]
MKVALIHDHLAQDGGAEKVLKVLADMFPEAPIYTLLYEKKNVLKYFKGRKIETSIIQKLPGGIKHYQWYMPFMPMAVEFFDLSQYDLVISDASAFAKGVITSPDTLHICYCHTPTRYVWDYTHQYINELKYNKYFKKIISLVLNYIRLWDRQAADRVDKFIANSYTVQKRIKKYYRRGSIVIYPPVELNKFYISDDLADYFLIGGRLAPYKRVDLAIKACSRLGKKLKIFGDGVDLARLKKIAGDSDNIEFLGRVNNEIKAELYSKCQAFLNPQEEDFGITMIEAMASGRPVIAFRKGGAAEIVVKNATGKFFNKQTVEDLVEVLRNFNSRGFDPKVIRRHAEKFSTERFKREIEKFIKEEYNKHVTYNT